MSSQNLLILNYKPFSWLFPHKTLKLSCSLSFVLSETNLGWRGDI